MNAGLGGWDGGSKAALAVLAVVAVAVAGCNLYCLTYEEPSVTVGDLTLTGGIVNLVDADEYGGTATLTYSGGGDAEWRLYHYDGTALVDDGDGTYSERAYETAATGGTLTVTEPGTYGVRLYVDGSLEGSGTMVLDGEVTRTYSWTQSIWRGETYTYAATFSYMYSDYASYADAGVVRHSNSESAYRFIAVDDAISSLESALRAEYLSVRGAGSSVTGQAYADYLLSFVQCCFQYPTKVSQSGDSYVYDPEGGNGDLFLYGSTEYWAYPLETIHHGLGDCEDTSFLAAALFEAAGYTAGVVVLTDHMVAAVLLDEFVPVDYPDTVVSLTAVQAGGGVMYYCETTVTSFIASGYLDVETSAEALEGRLYLSSRSRGRRGDPSRPPRDRVADPDGLSDRYRHQVPGGNRPDSRGLLGHCRLGVGSLPEHHYPQVDEDRQLRFYALDERDGVVGAQVVPDAVPHGGGHGQ